VAGVTAPITVGPWPYDDPARNEGHHAARHRLLSPQRRPTPPGAPVQAFLQNAGTWLELADRPPPHVLLRI